MAPWLVALTAEARGDRSGLAAPGTLHYTTGVLRRFLERVWVWTNGGPGSTTSTANY